jgi:hypothetical protein
VTVTLDTDDAPSRYHNSTRLFVPVNNPTGPFTHVPPPESDTLNTDAELPAASATDATNASPDTEADESVAANVAAFPLTTFCCTNAIGPPPPPPAATVAETVATPESTVPSFALYVNESDPLNPESGM